MNKIDVYTDGGCAPTNPGKGACAYAIVKDDQLLRSEVFTSPDSTGNIMELTAALKALEFCVRHYKDYEITLYTDSQYLQQGITTWIHNWRKNGWRNGKNKPVANKEIWLELYDLNLLLNVKYEWVRSHSGNAWNDFVDKLCQNKPM